MVSPSCIFLLLRAYATYRADGYLTRFGVTYVDYETQERYPKESAKFLVKVWILLISSGQSI